MRTINHNRNRQNGRGATKFRSIAVALAIPLLALAGCGDSSSNGDEDTPGGIEHATINVVVANPYQEKLLARNDTDRKLALRRAVQDDGGTCTSIRAARFQQNYKGMAMWVASCTRADWAVYLAPSGVVQVRACKDSAELGLPKCEPAPVEKALKPLWSQDSNPLPAPVNQL